MKKQVTDAVVEVLLATYNGERFLQAQIDSVRTQENVAVRILARDDGSSDATPSILAANAKAHPEHFRVLPTEAPTGSAKENFYRLVLSSTGQYVAFCDQDDVWLPQKLHNTLRKMALMEAEHGSSTPLLVATDLQVVDEALRPVASSLWKQNGLTNAQHPRIGQLLGNNSVTGCTALLNRALVDRLRLMPPQALMHDHWAALVAAGTGNIAMIPQATVLYRQHDTNVIGAIGQNSLMEKIGRLTSRKAAADRATQYERHLKQALALLQTHGSEMSADTKSILAAFASLPARSKLTRLRTMIQHHLWRGGITRAVADILDVLRG